jgi:hypothetical protein
MGGFPYRTAADITMTDITNELLAQRLAEIISQILPLVVRREMDRLMSVPVEL